MRLMNPCKQLVLSGFQTQQLKVRPQMNGDVGDGVIPPAKMAPSEAEGGGWSVFTIATTTSTLALALFLGYRYIQKHQT